MVFFIGKTKTINAKGKYKGEEFNIPDNGISRDVELNDTLDLWQHGGKDSLLTITLMSAGSFLMTKSDKKWQLKPTDDVPGSTSVNVEIGDVRPGDEGKL